MTFKNCIALLLIMAVCFSCKDTSSSSAVQPQTIKQVTAKEILGNPEYLAISYGGYRKSSRDSQPAIAELKKDMRILSAMGVKLLRTYNVHLPHASNLLQAIRELKQEDPSFEMYVMLGAWIDCKNAWTNLPPDHERESQQNAQEIAKAVALTNEYSDIVKIIAVGNEAMVKWATSYYVQPRVILKWVNLLQGLKKEGQLPKELWITSSDNFASWGGGGSEYHVEDLNQLIKAVDFISLHTYPMHDTHYNPHFWGVLPEETSLTEAEKIEAAMERALEYAVSQYQNTVDYMRSLGVEKPVHIGETGWASFSNEHYGPDGSKATDEYKEGRYYHLMRNWTNQNNISCFYFEAFDETWKDANNPGGSENHFGLFTIDGQAKYALWDLVDTNVFEGLSRGNQPITKTYGGDKQKLLKDVLSPPLKEALQMAH